MKDLIAKLQLDANCALGAIWMHIDAQAARIAELEAQIAAKADTDKLHNAIMNLPCTYTNEVAWDSSDRDKAKNSYLEGHRDARHAAAELVSSTALQAPVREVPDDLQIVPKISTSKMDRAGEAVIEGENHCDCGNYPMPNLEKVFSAMIAAAPLPAAPVQPEGGE